MGSHFLLQRIFPSQGLNADLPHCRWILYQLSYQGSLMRLEGFSNHFPRFSLLFWKDHRFPMIGVVISLLDRQNNEFLLQGFGMINLNVTKRCIFLLHAPNSWCEPGHLSGLSQSIASLIFSLEHSLSDTIYLLLCLLEIQLQNEFGNEIITFFK